MVYQAKEWNFHITSPAKFIDLHTPTEFTKPIDTSSGGKCNEVVQWSFEKITHSTI
jgi:hypothetical protein